MLNNIKLKRNVIGCAELHSKIYAKKVLLMLNNTDIWRDAADYLVGGGGEKL